MIKRPLVVAVIGYIIGIILGLYFIKISIALFFSVIIIISFLGKKTIRYIKIIFPKKAIIIFTIFVLIGCIHLFVLNKKYDRIYQINENIEVTGVVEDIEIKEYSTKYIIKVEKIDDKKYVNTKLILYIKNKQEKLEYGDCIKLFAKYSAPEESRNYKGFSYKDYLKQNNIYGTISSIGKIEVVKKDKVSRIKKFANNLRNTIINEANSNLSRDASSVFIGILLGEKSQITDEISTYFREGNMAHILAVSGAHVSYIILFISMLFRKTKRKIYLISTIIILIFFMVLTNFTPSVVRACIMAIIALSAKLIYRKSDMYNNLSLSCFIILISNPYTILNIGFQLTYLGTLGIVLFNKKILEFVNRKIQNKEHKYSKLKIITILKNKFKKFIVGLIVISISVQILIMPIIIISFNTISYNFLISSVIATPIFSLIMFIGIFTLIFNFFKEFCFPILEILIDILIFISKFISSIPFSKLTIPTPSVVVIIAYYIMIIVILILKSKFAIRIRKLRKLSKKLISILIIICIIIQFNPINNNKHLKIYFIDVGQGDSSLIITPQNKVILIDGGGSLNEEYDVGKNTLVPYLLDRGITKIDYLMVSHFDNDHCGGLTYVLETLKVKNIIISKQAQISDEYKKFMKLAIRSKINIVTVKQGDLINIDSNIKMYILNPSYKLKFNDLNNNSIVAKLIYNNFSIMFTGDIEEMAEDTILRKYTKDMLESTVLKVAHHGSKTSSTQEFLNMVKPRIALIGVGKNNTFGHPNAEVIHRLQNLRYKNL